jgi:hypothetical protein
MSIKTAKQFKPEEQLQTAFEELQRAMQEARRAIDRVEWLKDRLVQKFQTVDEFEVFTEAQAAEIFGMTERNFADHRRQFNFPHIAFGRPPKYTREHLEKIAAMFEVNTSRPAAGIKAA